MRERILPHTGEFSSGVLSFLFIDIDLGKKLVVTINTDHDESHSPIDQEDTVDN